MINSDLRKTKEKYQERLNRLAEKYDFMETIKWLTGEEDVYFLLDMPNGRNTPPPYYRGVDRIEFRYDRKSNSYRYIDSNSWWELTPFNSKESLEKHILELYNSLDLDMYRQCNWHKAYNFLPISQEAKDYLKNITAKQRKARISMLKDELEEAENALKKDLGEQNG